MYENTRKTVDQAVVKHRLVQRQQVTTWLHVSRKSSKKTLRHNFSKRNLVDKKIVCLQTHFDGRNDSYSHSAKLLSWSVWYALNRSFNRKNKLIFCIKKGVLTDAPTTVEWFPRWLLPFFLSLSFFWLPYIISYTI